MPLSTIFLLYRGGQFLSLCFEILRLTRIQAPTDCTNIFCNELCPFCISIHLYHSVYVNFWQLLVIVFNPIFISNSLMLGISKKKKFLA
jgi:hypothetical protein